jgi:hypothetical protein
MPKAYKKKFILDVTLEQWLELMEKRPKNVDFCHFRFPTDEFRDHFLANIFNYSEKTITEILNSFLDVGTFWGSDQSSLNHLERLMEDDQGTQNGERNRHRIWSASDADRTMGKAGTRWLAQRLLNASKRAAEKRRGVDCHPLPTNRPTESAGGLVGKKITNPALKPNERSLSQGILM